MIKVIKGYGGRYSISNSGVIYSNGRVMTTYTINSGYKSVKLQYKGLRKSYLVHRLVAEYFLSGTGVVDHIDGDRLNNSVYNLRYCTQKENLYFNGFKSGYDHYKHSLSPKDVDFIRLLRNINGYRNRDIYQLYPEVSHTTIDRVLNYKSYRGNIVLTYLGNTNK